MTHASLVAMQTVLSALAIVIIGSVDTWFIDRVWSITDESARAAITAGCWFINFMIIISLVVSQSNPVRLLFYTKSLDDALWNWTFATFALVLVIVLIMIHCQTIHRIAHLKSTSED